MAIWTCLFFIQELPAWSDDWSTSPVREDNTIRTHYGFDPKLTILDNQKCFYHKAAGFTPGENIYVGDCRGRFGHHNWDQRPKDGTREPFDPSTSQQPWTKNQTLPGGVPALVLLSRLKIILTLHHIFLRVWFKSRLGRFCARQVLSDKMSIDV